MERLTRIIFETRKYFSDFYSIACPHEASAMDALIACRVGLLLGLNTPRQCSDELLLAKLEKATALSEQKFCELRDRLRSCEAFRKLSDCQRRTIEVALFTAEIEKDN